MSDVLNVTVRQTRGTRSARRERAHGKVPAILYGHGKESVSLSLAEEELDAVMRHGSQVVDLKGEVDDSALIRDIQWDAFGIQVLHLDLTRVSATEVVEVTVPVELRGEAPGVREGGIVDQSIHEIELECPVRDIPEKIEVTINELKLHDAITVGDITFPPNVKVRADAEATIVACVEPTAPLDDEDEVPGLAVPGEPEVIGQKDDDEGEGAGD